jgi:integrase
MDKTRGNPRGVKPREKAIQIYFRLKGEDSYCYETLPWNPTPANLAKAGKLRAEITDKIKHDVFVYGDYFPDSPRARVATGTFYDFAQSWLDDPTHDWTPQSRYKFKGILQRVWVPFLDTRHIRHITPGTLTEALASAIVQFKFKNGDKEPSKSLFNDWLLCARGVFATAIKAGAIKPVEDPTQYLKNKTRDQTDIDPFDTREANAIITAMYENYGDTWGAYFELGFYSGMRYPSEPAALTWLDVDLNKGEIRINKSHTRLGLQHRTKTSKSRVLYLNSRSRNALERLQGFTSNPTIFVNSKGGDTFNAKLQRTMWKEVLTRLEIRYRDMYNMRHTYATFGLMNGVNPAFMAGQLGHSVEEFFKTYAKWINSEQNESQLRLLESAIAQLARHHNDPNSQ